MTATTTERNTPERESKRFSYPMAASVKCLKGTIVCINASGLATPGATSTTLKTVGMAEETADNTAGAASAIGVPVRRGTFRFANSASGDLITLADVGSTCYVVDNQTVAKTNGTNTRSAAGIVRDVDADGVFVEI